MRTLWRRKRSFEDWCEASGVAADQSSGEWILQYESADWKVRVENLDGVSWADAPIPPLLHRCKPQTRGWVDYFDQVLRCACGAISRDGKYWMEKNQRVQK